MPILDRLRSVYTRSTALFGLLWEHSLRIGAGAAVALFIWQATVNEVVIDQIYVPPDLEAKGITSKIITSRLIDRLREIRRADIFSERPGASFRSQADQVDIEAPGGGTSLQALVRFLRHVIGTEDLRIYGEVTLLGEDLSIRLRGSRGDRFQVVSASGSLSKLEDLLGRVAQGILEQIDPLTVAQHVTMLQEKPDPETYIPIVKKALQGADAKERARALILLSYLAESDGRTSEAVELAKHATAVDPSSAEAHHLWGYIVLPTNPSEAALKARRAIALAPRVEDGHHLLALALFAQKRDKEAIEVLVAGLDTATDPMGIYSLLSINMRRLGRHEEFLRIANARDRHLSRHPGFHYGIGRAKMARGDADEGRARIQIGIRLATPSKGLMAHGYRHIGEALAEKGQHEGAVNAFKKALELNPKLDSVKKGLAESLSLIDQANTKGGQTQKPPSMPNDAKQRPGGQQ